MRDRAEHVLRYVVQRARQSSGWPTAAAAAYVTSALAVCALALHAADRIGLALTSNVAIERFAPSRVSGPAESVVAAARAKSKVLSDEWNRGITSESFWRSRKAGSGQSRTSSNSGSGGMSSPPVGWLGAPPAYDWFADPDDDEQPPPRVSRPVVQRTVCVRLCDGFFFPIGYGSVNISRDAAACERRCPGAKLYIQRGGSLSGTELDGLVDLAGQPYSKLKAANLFRTSYDAACKCKPHPWEPEAQEQHRIYALEYKRRKGDKAAIAELKRIKAAKQAEARAKRERRRLGLPETPQSAPVARVDDAPAVASSPVPPEPFKASAPQPSTPASPSVTPQPTPAAVVSAQPEPNRPESTASEAATPLKPLTGGRVPVASTNAEPAARTDARADDDAPSRASKSSRRRTAAQRQQQRSAARPGRSWVSTAFGQ